jgi:hypothetical protein
MAKSITIPPGITEKDLHDALVFQVKKRLDLGTHKMNLTQKRLETLADVGRALMLNGKSCFFCCEVAKKQKKATKKTRNAKWEAFVPCSCVEARAHEVIPQPKPKTAQPTKKPKKKAHVEHKDPSAQGVIDDLVSGKVSPETVVHSGTCTMDGCKGTYAITAQQVVNAITHLKLEPGSYRWTHRCLKCKRAAENTKRRNLPSNAAPAKPVPVVREIEGIQVSTEAASLKASVGDIANAKKVATA